MVRPALLIALCLGALTGHADDLMTEGGDSAAESLDDHSQPTALEAATYILASTSTPKTLSLEECVLQAISKHTRVALSEQDLMAADAAARQSLAALMPNLSAVLTSTDTHGALPSENPPPGVGADVAAILGIPVFHGSELFSTRSLRAAFLAKTQLHEHLKRSVELRTKELYHIALAAKHIHDLKKRQVERAGTLLESSKRRKAAGLHTLLDLKRAEYTLLKAKENEGNAEFAFRSALGNLGLFIGEDVHFELSDVPRPKPDDVGDAVAKTHDDLFALALERRFDLRGQRHWIESAYIAETSAWMAFAPSIDLDGELHYSISGSLPDRTPFLSEVNLRLSLPLFEGGARIEAIRQAKAKSRREKLRLDYMKREVQLALRGTLQSLQSKRGDLAVKKEAKDLAQAVYQSTLNRFKEGLSTAFEVQDATNTLATAETEEEREWLDFALLKAQLDYTVGRQSILEKPATE